MNLLSEKRVLVTGGAGFIGSSICHDLLERGNEVVCLDNFATGKRENISDLKGNPKFRLIEGDIRDIDTCHKAVKGIDVVLHQAALGSVPRSIADPATTNAVNINGFLNMLIATRDAGIQRFVYASSSSVYGDSPELPKVEERTGKVLSPYAITKMVNEEYARVFGSLYGMETIGLRYFNVFGRRQDPNGPYAAVIPKFTMAFMKYESPVINGDGSNSRDFTYIDNVVLANNLAATAENPAAINQAYNVACGDSVNLNEMTSMLRGYLAEKDSKIADVNPLHGPNRPGDIPHSMASIGKAVSLLGYNPVVRFSEGLQRAVEWYVDNL
ncbi:MAG: SDR family oxidoreductase [Bacteroidota bacterium]|jgi:UDP-N-acetylglucosamine 4-epimerase|nr:SDR family oxidoreductase [Bacteroidota bacterium]